MKAIQIEENFGIDNLKLVEKSDSCPLGPRDVRVKVNAVSLNYRDLMVVEGSYNPKQPLPLVPCSDASCEVIEIGEKVDRVAVGDRVMTLMTPHWLGGAPSHRALRTTLGSPLSGTLTEFMVLDQEALVKTPNNLNDIEASTLTCAALTAWSALMTQGGLQPGETVLLQGTGGVSLFGLLFAKAAGAEVIITSSSNEKLNIAKELGADHTVNYREVPEWGKEVRRLTNKRGVDHVVEVGGAGTLTESLRAVAIGGTIYVIGVLGGVKQEMSVLPLLMQNVRMQGVYVGHRESFESMVRAIELHDIHPHIDTIYPFDDAPEAFRALKSAKHVGKIVIKGVGL